MMKKLLVFLTILFLIPVTVNAFTIDTGFDGEKCELTVTGTQEGNDASVYLFSSTDEFIGMKTGTITNGNYSVKFVLKYDEETTIKVMSVNEDGDNETTKNNVVIPVCHLENNNNNNNNNDDNNNNNNNNNGNDEFHTVHFDTHGGSEIGDVQVPHENLVEKPKNNPTKEGHTFGGWYEDDQYERPFIFSRGIIEDTIIHARWIANDDLIEYVLDGGNGNSLSFFEENGQTFRVTIFDLLTFSDAELEEAGIPAAQFKQIKAILDASFKKEGKIIGVFGIELYKQVDNDPSHDLEVHDGPFTIKIKLTKEMKKYDTFKLIYVDQDENGIITEKPIVLKVEGEYLVGTIPHLSVYVLTGSSSTTSNPSTGDNIYLWVNTLVVSVVVLSAGAIVYKVTRKKK